MMPGLKTNTTFIYISTCHSGSSDAGSYSDIADYFFTSARPIDTLTQARQVSVIIYKNFFAKILLQKRSNIKTVPISYVWSIDQYSVFHDAGHSTDDRFYFPTVCNFSDRLNNNLFRVFQI